MSALTLSEILNPRHYEKLQGGTLEAVGRLCKNNICLYIYPAFHPATGAVLTAADIPIEPELASLHRYLLERGTLHDLEQADRSYLAICSAEVLDLIRKGAPEWEDYVPAGVSEVVKQRNLFGYR